MSLDPHTLLVVNVVNLLATALLLPAIMGRALSPAARDARRSLIVQAVAWVAIILSEQGIPDWANRLLSTLSMCAYSASNWLIYRALAVWLGRRRGGRLLLALSFAMPIGYALLFEYYAARVGWANLLIAAQVALLALATRFPTHQVGAWRHALGLCFAAMAILTLGRGVLGAFFTADYPSFAAPHPLNVLSLLVANVTMVLGNVSVLVAWREEAERQLRDLAIVDPLTGVLNRQGWNEQGERLFGNALRYNQPLALLTCDLDHFKQVNDTRGHEAGDRALRLFGQLLRAQLRHGDVAARMGGEEFCILLQMAHPEAARRLDQRLRAALAACSSADLGFALSFSSGLACRSPDDTNLTALRRRADTALYAAKHAGRGHLQEA